MMLMTVVWSYLYATVAVAAWLGLVMWRCLDEFDWRYRSSDIWLGFWLSLLLWPLFLIVLPRTILRGDGVLDVRDDKDLDISGSMANRMRRLHQISIDPPECGATVVYRYPETLIENQKYIDLIFRSADIAGHFKGKDLPLFWHEEKKAIVAFIKARDESSDHIAEIPGDINFDNMAFDLIDNNLGQVNCPVCQFTYGVDELEAKSPPMHAGWNFRTYSCPNGHKLFSRRTMHILARRN